MQEKIEQIISRVYKNWRRQHEQTGIDCPDEEVLADFLEGRLAEEEGERLKRHLIRCDDCLEVVSLVSQKIEEIPLPEELITRVKDIVMQQTKIQPALLEIILALRQTTIDLIKTSGDILFGQEFAPLPVLRSRNIKDFGEEVKIVKDLGSIRTEIEIENKTNYSARITVKLSDVNSGKPSEALRVSLIRNEAEVESYISEAGKAVFDHIVADKYEIEISSPQVIIGRVLLEIKKE